MNYRVDCKIVVIGVLTWHEQRFCSTNGCVSDAYEYTSTECYRWCAAHQGVP